MALNIVFSFWARNACAFIRELTNTNVDGREGDPQHCFIRMRVYTRMSKHKCWREKRRPSTLLKMLSYIACLNLFWATHLNLVLFRLPRKSSNADEARSPPQAKKEATIVFPSRLNAVLSFGVFRFSFLVVSVLKMFYPWGIGLPEWCLERHKWHFVMMLRDPPNVLRAWMVHFRCKATCNAN